jgi:hypothetical protein
MNRLKALCDADAPRWHLWYLMTGRLLDFTGSMLVSVATFTWLASLVGAHENEGAGAMLVVGVFALLIGAHVAAKTKRDPRGCANQ